MAKILPFAALVLLIGCEGIFGSPGASNGARKIADAANVASDSAAAVPTGTSHVALHRLTNDEYTNTLQDLLFTQARPGDAFPRASIGESGFKNDSQALAVNDDWVSRAYSAADAAASELVASKGAPNGAYARIVTCATANRDCATTTLATLGARAYRRPIQDDELAALMAAFDAQTSFDTGLHDAVVTMLLSPSFLFVAAPAAGNEPVALDGFALAARLSYFLWQTMPDAELFAAAKSGALATDDGLVAQAKRMLADPRALRLARTLVREWAGLATLESSSIDGLTDELRAAMVKESDLFVAELLTHDRPLIELVRADYTFANEALADLYGVPFPGDDPNAFVRVDLAGKKRKGIGTQASVLTVTAGAPDVTHPVRRGFWVAQRVMCMSPPPPPADVPPLPPAAPAQSIRDRLNQHVASPACSGCHVVMDAVGLGLENYDPLGRWRDSYRGESAAIDASGELPGGAAFASPEQMFASLAEDESVRTCLGKQVLSLALTRVVKGPADAALAKALGGAETFTQMVAAIVKSRQFREQVAE